MLLNLVKQIKIYKTVAMQQNIYGSLHLTQIYFNLHKIIIVIDMKIL